ncbi:MAG: protein kinase [Acidobacteria bacterium]|nr:protein kinase [Acidobacteriota bacterium]
MNDDPVAGQSSRSEDIQFPTETGEGAGERWSGRACGQYQILELLGEGGMGQVYRAHDTVLNRSVALKLLASADPRLVARFLLEARAQARVEHEHICKVYGTGELEGTPYIAMQIVTGRTLRAAYEEMSLEAKVQVMMHVAEAVHAAHRHGLIHRDLKPGNIMVEQAEDGRWIPYVMDFGLAREVGGPGVTSTGLVVGTPFYMAPEQAEGRHDKMDRRTDVYGLGATFYHLLTKQPPFAGSLGIDVLLKVLGEDPVPVRRLNSAIPSDLEVVVMKCLEKESARRYDSARAVAEELRRYLDGDPIRARRKSWMYRAARKARKHLALFVVSVAAILALSVLAGVWIRERLSAAERATVARQFGQEVERIDAIMRIASLVPIHDIRREKAMVRKAMNRIEGQMQWTGRSAEPAGAYALGRGNLALKNYDQAREDLEEARHAGYDEPALNYALGLTLGHLYQRQLDLLDTISNKDLREERRKEIEIEYREPAVRYLTLSRGVDLVAPEYAEGLIAYYKGQYAQAVEKARAAFRRGSWLYEAKICEAATAEAIGNEKRDRAEYDAAMESYRDAEKLLQQAAGVGASDVECYQNLARLYQNMMLADAFTGAGENVTRYRDAALAACDKALVVDPDSPETYAHLSAVHWAAAQFTLRHGENPSAALGAALDAAATLTRLKPQDATSWLLVASTWLPRARFESLTGKNPAESFANAIGNYERALSLKPHYMLALNALASTYALRAWEYEVPHGVDPRGSIESAISVCRRAVEADPKSFWPYGGMALALWTRSNYEMLHGIDPTHSLDAGDESIASSLAVNPRITDNLLMAGNLKLVRAQYAVKRGTDPAPHVEAALGFYQRVLEIDPARRGAIINSALAIKENVAYRIATGKDASALLSAARERIGPMLEGTFYRIGVLQIMTELALLEAEVSFWKGAPVDRSLAEARDWIDRAIELDPQAAPSHQVRGAIELLDAQWRAQHSLPAGESLARARKALSKAAGIDPRDATIRRLLGELELRVAEATMGRDKASALASVEKGLSMCDQAIKLDAEAAEAVAIKGALYLARAWSTPDAAARRAIAQKSIDSLRHALDMNPLLKREYEPLLTQAGRMQ